MRTAVCLVLFSATGAFADLEHWQDAARGLSFDVPAGYRDFPEGRRTPRDVAAFARGKLGEGSYGLIGVTALSGVLAPGSHLIPEVVERAARAAAKQSGIDDLHFAYRKVRWGEFELDLVATTASAGARHILMLAVQVPLTGEAVQLVVTGPTEDAPLLQRELDGVLASLQAKSNWPTAAQRDARISLAIGFAGGVAGVVLLCALVVGVLIWRARSSRAR